jgi:hypothetical protein
LRPVAATRVVQVRGRTHRSSGLVHALGAEARVVSARPIDKNVRLPRPKAECRRHRNFAKHGKAWLTSRGKSIFDPHQCDPLGGAPNRIREVSDEIIPYPDWRQRHSQAESR